jgi:hypothetical protein
MGGAGASPKHSPRSRPRWLTAAAILAVPLVRHDRQEEAIHYADLAAAWAAPDDISSQVGQPVARARALAVRGELERAEAAARSGATVRAFRGHLPARRRAHDLRAVARPLLALIDGWGSTRGLAARRVTKRGLRASPVARIVALAAAAVTVTAVVTLALVVLAIAQLV